VYGLANWLADHGHEVSIITASRPLGRELKAKFRIIEMDGFDDKNPQIWRTFAQLNAHFRDHIYDVVHINNYVPYFLFTCAVEPNPVTRYVFTTHNTPSTFINLFGGVEDYPTEELIVRRLLDDGPHSLIISNGPEFTKSLSAVATKPQRILEIPHGVQVSSFMLADRNRVRAKYQIKDHDVLILCTSRFVRRKNIRMLIEALSTLPANFKLLLTGSACPEGLETDVEIRDLVKRLDLEDSIIMLAEPVPFDEIPDYYKAADVFALTSTHEGFAIAILEAMASGTVVVATDVPGSSNLVQDGVTGLLVELGDVEALASQLLKADQDVQLTRELVDNALRMVLSKFDSDVVYGAHLNAYEKLLSQ
jgi:glycosyltransferase involved in cell wall biosynthesis